MTWKLGATPITPMPTADPSDALHSAQDIDGVPLGTFIPDPAALERLANAFFSGVTGGAPIGSLAVPASPPAPWSAPAQPSTPLAAAAIPVPLPFGAPDAPTDGVPSSLPLRSFGGASAGSASPFAFAQSRAVAPAATQTATAAPRVDPLTSSELGSTARDNGGATYSPFAAPVDLGAVLSPFGVALQGTNALPSAGRDLASPSQPSVPSALRGGDFAPVNTHAAINEPLSLGDQPEARPGVAPSRAAPTQPGAESSMLDAGFWRLPPSPFAEVAVFAPTQHAFSAAPLYGAPRNERAGLPVAERGTAIPADRSGASSAPTAASAAAPAAAISPVFSGATSGTRPLDAASVRNDFPILQEKVHGRRLVWLDNGATTQKPQAVIDRLVAFYTHENSNVHRGAHTLAARATDAYEAAREKARRFLGASSTKEIVFVRGATEGVNLVAQSWGRRNVKAGDEIVVTWLEHHANIVPWQQLCLETGAKLRVAPVDDRGDVLLDEYEKLLGPRTRIVAFTQVSNALGTVTPAREMITAAHRHGALTLLDGAQSVSHMRTDVLALDADFFVLSGHKMFAPTGIGVVYGKQAILETMTPWQGGGNMIADVTFERTAFQAPPDRFEAGTGNIADAVGLGAAIDYLDGIGMGAIARHEHELIDQTVAGLKTIRGVKLVGAPRERAGVVSFLVDGCRTEDVGKALDREGIAVRAGHHCAQPILRRFGIESSVRPSFALYNTAEDVEVLIEAVRRIALTAQGGSR
jgi:cysteine desulfurase/selenocysteine lyase